MLRDATDHDDVSRYRLVADTFVVASESDIVIVPPISASCRCRKMSFRGRGGGSGYQGRGGGQGDSRGSWGRGGGDSRGSGGRGGGRGKLYVTCQNDPCLLMIVTEC